MRRLRREQGVEPPVLEPGCRRPRLHRRWRHALADDAASDDHLAALEDAVVSRDRNLSADIAADLGEERDLAAQRRFEVDDGVQRLIVDVDELRRIDALGGRFGEHDGDDVPGEAHHVARERRPLHARLDAPEVRAARLEVDVGRGQDSRVRRARVDALDSRVRKGERTKVAWSAPSSSRLSTYRPAPVRKRGSSLRRTRCPITLMPRLLPAHAGWGRRSVSVLPGDHRVPEHADLLDLRLHDVARLQVQRGRVRREPGHS